MTPDRAAIDAVRDAIEHAIDASGSYEIPLEQTATLAVTTLQGLGWRPPAPRSIRVVSYQLPISGQIAAEGYQLPVPDTCRSHSVLTRQSLLGIELVRCLDCGTSLAPEKPMPETITLDAR